MRQMIDNMSSLDLGRSWLCQKCEQEISACHSARGGGEQEQLSARLKRFDRQHRQRHQDWPKHMRKQQIYCRYRVGCRGLRRQDFPQISFNQLLHPKSQRYCRIWQLRQSIRTAHSRNADPKQSDTGQNTGICRKTDGHHSALLVGTPKKQCADIAVSLHGHECARRGYAIFLTLSCWMSMTATVWRKLNRKPSFQNGEAGRADFKRPCEPPRQSACAPVTLRFFAMFPVCYSSKNDRISDSPATGIGTLRNDFKSQNLFHAYLLSRRTRDRPVATEGLDGVHS